MATGLNMFSLVEELSSPAFRKIAALVSPKRGYPELPDYPTIPALPIYSITLFVVNNKYIFTTNNKIHKYNTRNNNNLHHALSNLTKFNKGPCISGYQSI